jgi:hypothetical protein
MLRQSSTREGVRDTKRLASEAERWRRSSNARSGVRLKSGETSSTLQFSSESPNDRWANPCAKAVQLRSPLHGSESNSDASAKQPGLKFARMQGRKPIVLMWSLEEVDECQLSRAGRSGSLPRRSTRVHSVTSSLGMF